MESSSGEKDRFDYWWSPTCWFTEGVAGNLLGHRKCEPVLTGKAGLPGAKADILITQRYISAAARKKFSKERLVLRPLLSLSRSMPYSLLTLAIMSSGGRRRSSRYLRAIWSARISWNLSSFCPFWRQRSSYRLTLVAIVSISQKAAGLICRL